MKLGALQIGIIALVVATAAIHLAIGIPNGFVQFILNGVGYLGLVAALYMPMFKKYQNWVRWALIAYAAVTVLAWIFIGERSLIGYADKVIEVALIGLLFAEGRK